MGLDRWLERSDRLPTWARVVGTAAAVMFVLIALNLLSLVVGQDSWIVVVLVLILVVALLGLQNLINRRRLGGRGQARLMRRSVRSGQVLPGANRDQWRSELARTAARRRGANAMTRRMVAMFAIFVAAVTVASLLATDPVTALFTVAPLIITTLVLSYVGLVVAPRQRRKVEVLERELASDD